MSTGLSSPVSQPNSLSSFLNDLNELAGLKQQETQLATQIASGNPRDVLRTDTITFPNGMKRPATDAELMAAARTLSDMPTAKMQGMSAAGDILGNVPFVRDVVNAPTSMAAYIAARRITNGPDDWLVRRTNPGMSKGAAFATIEAARRQMESTEGGVKQFYANLGLPEPAANFVSGVHQQGVGNLEFLPVVLSSAVVTNGLAVGARKAGQNAVADLLEMEAKDAFQKGAGNLVQQQAVRFGANAVNAAINPMAAPREALQRITPRGVEQTATGEFVPTGGESLATAIPKAVMSQTIEMQSEGIGEIMGPALGAALRRSGLSAKAVAAVPDFVKRWAASRGAKTIQSLASDMKSSIPGFNGVPQEILEERINEVWQFAAGTQQDAGLTGKVLQGDVAGATEQLAQEGVAFGIMGGVNRGLGRKRPETPDPRLFAQGIMERPEEAAIIRRLPNNPSRKQWADAARAIPELAELDARSAQDRADFMQSFRQADDMAEQRRMDDVFEQHAPAVRDRIRNDLVNASQTPPTFVAQPSVPGGKNMGLRKGVATPRQIISEQEVVPPSWPEPVQEPQPQGASDAAQQVQEQGRPEGQVAETPQQQPQQPVAEQKPAVSQQEPDLSDLYPDEQQKLRDFLAKYPDETVESAKAILKHRRRGSKEVQGAVDRMYDAGVTRQDIAEFGERARKIVEESGADWRPKIAALEAEYSPKSVKGELDDTNAPLKPEEQIDLPLWEMDDEQLRVAHDKARKGDMALYESVFGKEGAKKYRSLLRQENSFDRTVSDRAAKERHDMEDALTEQQQDMLFNSDIPDPQVISRFREAVSQGASNPRELGAQLGIEMIRLSGDVGKEPADMTLDKQLSLAAINAAKRYAANSGWTTQEHLDEINRGAVEYVTSHVQIDDVDMILRPWGLSTKATRGPRQESQPERPKIGRKGATKGPESPTQTAQADKGAQRGTKEAPPKSPPQQDGLRGQTETPEGEESVADVSPSQKSGRVAAVGGDTQIDVPSGEPIAAKYAVIEAADIVPSHSYLSGGVSDNRKKGAYPEGLQPREYKIGSPADVKVRKFAQQKKVAYFISTHPDATNGPPVVSQDGIVINGNGRAMALQLASLSDYGWYKDALVRDAATYGISSEQVSSMDAPILVRVVAMDATSAEAKRFARHGNVATTYEDTPIRKAAAMSHLVNVADVVQLSNQITPDITIAGVLGKTSAGKAIREAMYQSMPESMRSQYFNDDRTFTNDGEEFATNLLLAKAFDADLIERLSSDRKALLQSLADSIVPILDLGKSDKGKRIFDAMQKALDIVSRRPSLKTSTDVGKMFAQRGLLEAGGLEDIDRSPMVRDLTAFFVQFASSRKKVRTTLLGIAADTRFQGGLFASEDSSPEEIVSDAVSKQSSASKGGGPQVLSRKLDRGGRRMKADDASDKPQAGTEFQRLDNPAQPPKEAPPRPVDVLESVRELFGGAIEPGRMWSKQAAGEFEIRTEAIHLAKGHEANLVVAGHELAHRIDKQQGVVRDSMPQQLKRALSELDYAPEVHAAQILKGADPLLSSREGFAEYVRHRLQGTTQHVARQVLVNDGTITQEYADALGVVDAWFENEWLPAHPDVAKRLGTITRAVDKYIAAGPQHRILAGTSGVDGIRPTLVSVKEYPDVGLRAIDDAIAGFRANWVNEWEYLERYEKEVVKRGGALPDDNLSALQFARSLDNAASLAKSFVDDGVRTWDGRTVLHDGLAAAFRRHGFKTAAEIDEWEAYHIARRVMAIHETRPEYRSSADIRDMEAMVAKIEADPSKADRYEAMTEDYTAFNNAVLDWAVGMGLVEADAAQRMKDSHGGVYMYMAREQRNRGKPSSFTPNVGMGIIPLHNPFKRLGRGSQMPFYRPIEAAVLKTYETISNAYQKQVVVQMWKSQRKAKGMGAWIEEVPAGNKANKVRLDDLLSQLVEAGVVTKKDADLIHAVGVVKKGAGNSKALRTIKQQLGIDADDFDDFSEYQSAVDEAAEKAGIANANDMLTTWMPNYAMSRKEGVFSFRDDTGQMRTVRVHPEIFNSLVMSRAYGAQNAFGKLINVMGGIVSRGAVRYNPAFPLANLVRDYWTQVAQANEQSLPETLVQPLNGVLQMTLDALKQHGIVAGERDIMTELFVEKGSAEWYAMNASPVGLHELRRKILTDAGVSQPLVVRDAVRGGLKSLTDVLTLGEAAVRRGEFVASLNNQGYYSVNNKWHQRADDGTLQPLPDGAQPPEAAIAKAALAARDVTVDFQTKGRLSKRIPMFFGPFFNAKVQSLDRMYRQIKTALAHPNKAVRDKAMRRLVAFAAMQSALAALIWYFTHDEDWYNADREPWIKYRYFQPVAGLRIPKGYEWSVFANVTEATLNIMFKKDPENAKKTVERFLTQRSELGELAYATAESVSPVSLPPKVPIVEDMPLVSTIYQLATNTDWRGKPIVTKDVADLETSEQYRDTTPAAYKAAGKAFGVSPLQIEYGADSLSGGVTRRAFRTYDKLAARNVTGAVAEAVAGGFTLPRDSSRATQDYFDALEKADKRAKTAERRKQPDPEAKDALDMLNAYGDVLKAIRKASREATTEEQKMDLWHMEIGTARDAIGRKALDRYKSAMSPDAKLPPEVQKARDQELLRQMRKIAANKPVSVTPLERTNGLTLAEKQAEWARDKKVAAQILRDAGWSWSTLAPVWTAGTDRTDSDGTKRARVRVAVDLGSR